MLQPCAHSGIQHFELLKTQRLGAVEMLVGVWSGASDRRGFGRTHHDLQTHEYIAVLWPMQGLEAKAEQEI